MILLNKNVEDVIMRFRILSSNKSNFENHISVLKNYNLECIKVQDLNWIDDEDYEFVDTYYIELNSLENLVELEIQLGYKIIINSRYEDTWSNEKQLAIEIYNGYRE
jgi:hypothetical protein